MAATPTARSEGRPRLPQTFADGTSKVVMLAERYGTCGSGGSLEDGRTAGSLWSDSNSRWRPVFCVNEFEQSAKVPTTRLHSSATFTCSSGRGKGERERGMVAGGRRERQRGVQPEVEGWAGVGMG
jgi:hypothetical protein